MSKRIRFKKSRKGDSSKHNSELPEIFNSIFFKGLLIGISIFITITVYNSAKITVQKLEILKQAEREVQELRIQNLYLSLGIKDMSTDRYLEKEARERLNFGDTGEILFVIPENVLEQAHIQVLEITEEKGTYEPGQRVNIEDWVSFLERGI
ncbi:MAG: septum formation initiator family protein [Candidatus Dojkabacteria bacterium]